jgi:hypothetical protein
MNQGFIAEFVVNDFCWLHRIPRGATIIKIYYSSNEYPASIPEFPTFTTQPLSDRAQVHAAQTEVGVRRSFFREDYCKLS